MNTVSGRVVLCALLLLSVFLCVSLGSGIGSATGPEQTLSITEASVNANETVPHQDPNEYDAEADSESTVAWLEGQLSARLGNSSVALSNGQYDLAQELLGDEYEDQFAQYAEVSGETGDAGSTDGDNSSAELFNESVEEQREHASLLAEYNKTRDEYEAAVEAGNERQARELARELNELAAEIESSSEKLDRAYENLSAMTEIDFSDIENSTAERNTTTQETQSTIRQTEFIQTDLNLVGGSENASFSDPMTISGEIQTADGSQLQNETIELTVANRTVMADTDSEGAFEFDYRPTMSPVSADSITVEYVPAADSVYLGSDTQVPVSLEQVATELSIQDSPPELAYGDEGTITGEFSAGGSVVDDVPIDIVIDGDRYAETTVENGTFSSSVAVPATLADGEHSIGAAFSAEDRALAVTEANTSVTIVETATEISAETSMEAGENGDNQLAVSGSLETAAGDGIANESVGIETDGAVSETVTTDANGTYSALIAVPETADEQLQVNVSYDGAGTSFASAAAEQTVSLSGGSSLLGVGSIRWIALGGGIGVVALGGTVLWSRRREDTADDTGKDQPDAVSEPPTEPPTEVPVETLLSAASDQFSSERYDRAVRSAYAAVRNADTRVDDTQAQTFTHWEFYDYYQMSLADDSRLDTDLRTLTETYEQAAFTPKAVSESEATTVLETAREFCQSLDSTRTERGQN